MDDEGWGCFVFGMIVGLVATIILYANYGIHVEVIDACEADLPRDQTCELYARPKGEE